MSCSPSTEPLTDDEKEWVSHHFDATDTERMQDPYRLFRYLRDAYPVARSDVFDGGMWVISRYEDVRRVARDSQTFISSPGVGVSPLGNERPMIPIETDRPDHAIYRRSIGDLFFPKAIAQQEAAVRAVTGDLITEILANDGNQVDVVRDLTYEQPMRVMWAEPFLGDPLLPMGGGDTSASATFCEWVHDFKHDPETTTAAASKMRHHVEEVLRHRSENPASDIPTRLLRAEVNGQPMTFDEAADFMFTLFSAGTATTGDALSGAFLHLASHPDSTERIRQGDVDMDLAVDELIRCFGPSQAERRTATTDVEVGEQQIKAGDAVLLLWNSANRDERVFDEPDSVVLDRSPNPHIAFGSGIHRCIGLHLARLQIRVAIEEWLAAVPEFHLRNGADLQWSVGLDRSLRSLEVEW